MILGPCRLCGGEPTDKGFGVECKKCGLWLGDGSKSRSLGGYKAVWNGGGDTTEGVIMPHDLRSTAPNPSF